MKRFVLLSVLVGVNWGVPEREAGPASLIAVEHRIRGRADRIQPLTEFETAVRVGVRSDSLTVNSLLDATVRAIQKYSPTTTVGDFSRMFSAFKVGMDYLKDYLGVKDASKIVGVEKLHVWVTFFDIVNSELPKIVEFKDRASNVVFILVSAGRDIVLSPTRQLATAIFTNNINQLKQKGVISGSLEDILIRGALHRILTQVWPQTNYSLFRLVVYRIQSNPTYFVIET